MDRKTTLELLQKSVNAFEAQNYDEASIQLSILLKMDPKNPEANHNMGILKSVTGNIEDALYFFEQALSLNKSTIQFWLSLADAYLKLGRFNDVNQLLIDLDRHDIQNPELDKLKARLKKINEIITKNPSDDLITPILVSFEKKHFDEVISQTTQMLEKFEESIVLLNLRGAAFAGKKKYNEAVDTYNKAITIDPNSIETLSNMGIALQEQGYIDKAITCYNRAIQIDPYFAEGYNNLGNLLRICSKYPEAELHLRKALELNTEFADAYNNLGNVLLEQDRIEEAIEIYNQALELSPGLLEVRVNLGNIYLRQSKFDEAVSKYESVISENPKCLEAYIYLAEALERSNLLDQMEDCINRALDVFNPAPPELQLMSALYNFRLKLYETASDIMSNTQIARLDRKKQIFYYQLKGKINEKLKCYSSAYSSFEKMNDLVRNDEVFDEFHGRRFIFEKKQVLTLLTEGVIPFHREEKINRDYDKYDISFIIGFPRSGTTLLDIILRTHSKTQVVEEVAAIDVVKKYLNEFGNFDFVKTFPADNLRSAAIEVYFKTLLSDTTHDSHATCIVDKLPLNLFELPLIHFLFPQAKYLVVRRNPLDSIISCWKQVFELNVAMSNMTRIDDIINFYVEADAFLLACQRYLNLDVHEVYYEKLITNYKKTLSDLLNFLNLDWEEGLIDHTDTALQSRRLKTPSYHQVIKPIYSESINAWRNYAPFLQEHFKHIEGVCKRLGYKLH